MDVRPIPLGGMGFFYGEIMARERKPAGDKAKKGSKPSGSTPTTADAKSLVKKAYQKVARKLDQDGNGKVIDDLVKLVKLEKDLGSEQESVKEIKVRWEQNGDESSNEE